MRTAFSVLILFSATSALAIPVRIDFSPSASAEFIALWHPEVTIGADATCFVQVDRPTNQEEARSSPANAIVCRATAQSEQLRFSFGESKVDSWGSHFEKKSFLVNGAWAEKLLSLFIKKTANLNESGMPNGTSWSKIVLCGPDGATCDESYFLDVNSGADASAQIACGRTTDLVRAPRKIEADEQTKNRADYYEYMIQKQVENQDRKISETHCSFLN